MTRDQVRRFYKRHYRPERMVVAVAGNVDHAKVVRLVRTAFSPPWLPRPAPPSRSSSRQTATPRRVGTGIAEATRQFEQVNVVLGVQGLTRSDPRRFALGVLNAALGGGTSSRLFQEVREKRGLAYSVFSFASQHVDAGLVGVSVGCLPTKLDQVLDVVRAELAKIAAGRHRRRGADPRQGPAQGRSGARPRGLRLADDPARQVRAGRRRAAQHRRGARPDRRRSPSTTYASSPPSCSPSRRSWPSSAPADRREPRSARRHVDEPVEPRHLLRAVEGPQHLLAPRLVRHGHPHLEAHVLQGGQQWACPSRRGTGLPRS